MRDGIEALEQRVDRNRKTFAPVFFSDKQMEEFISEIKSNCVVTIMTINMMVLKDKFGFGTTRLQRFQNFFEDLADSLINDWCSYIDLAKTLNEELGVELIDVENGQKILANMDESLKEVRNA